jgi:hypothetical protein
MRLNFSTAISVLAVAAAIALSSNAAAQDLDLDPGQSTIGKREYSPYLTRSFPDRVYFGDTHLHTSYSTDAGMFGTRLGPEEAYRFARGEEVISNTGLRARLQRPLDFLVISDHAENLGLATLIEESNADLLRTSFGKTVSHLVKSGKGGEAYDAWGRAMAERKDPLKGNEALTRTMWERLTAAAEKYNDPGKFTTLIGFEWTSSPDGNNLHRNVIFRDGKEKADQVIPFSQYDSVDPEDLWKWMGTYEQRPAGSSPSPRGNLSSG